MIPRLSPLVCFPPAGDAIIARAPEAESEGVGGEAAEAARMCRCGRAGEVAQSVSQGWTRASGGADRDA